MYIILGNKLYVDPFICFKIILQIFINLSNSVLSGVHVSKSINYVSLSKKKKKNTVQQTEPYSNDLFLSPFQTSILSSNVLVYPAAKHVNWFDTILNEFQVLLRLVESVIQNNKGFMTLCWHDQLVKHLHCRVTPFLLTLSPLFHIVHLGSHCASPHLGTGVVGQSHSPTLRVMYLHKLFGILLHERFVSSSPWN